MYIFVPSSFQTIPVGVDIGVETSKLCKNTPVSTCQSKPLGVVP